MSAALYSSVNRIVSTETLHLLQHARLDDRVAFAIGLRQGLDDFEYPFAHFHKLIGSEPTRGCRSARRAPGINAAVTWRRSGGQARRETR